MSLGVPEIILILLAIVLLFGAKKLPDLARSMGRSMRIFKSEINELHNESEQREAAHQAQAAQQPQATQQIQAPPVTQQPVVPEVEKPLQQPALNQRPEAERN